AAPLLIGNESEGFLFYRGVGDFDAPLTALPQEDGSVRVVNATRKPVGSVVLFTRHGNEVGYRLLTDLGASANIAAPALNGDARDLPGELERMLVGAGLYQREAAAMVNTWRDSWFEEGTRLFYV